SFCFGWRHLSAATKRAFQRKHHHYGEVTLPTLLIDPPARRSGRLIDGLFGGLRLGHQFRQLAPVAGKQCVGRRDDKERQQRTEQQTTDDDEPDLISAL